MKNIHILPTYKPSRLIIYSTLLNEFRLLDEPIEDWEHKKHIYITNSEEIKEGDWCMSLCDDESYEEIYQCKDVSLIDEEDKKIILTTDQDLINDGVQPIDDEFLEWFVKNPSCEYVEVEMNQGRYFDYGGNVHITNAYKIIIPKEEPKQSIKDRIMSDTSEESKQKARDYANSLVEKQETVFENAKLILRKHILKNKEQVIKDLDEMREQSKEQETLEEVAEKYVKHLKTNKIMKKYKLLQEETSFFTTIGTHFKISNDFSKQNLNQVNLCIDTGDKKDCGILLLNSKFDFIEVIQATSNASKKDLKEFYINNRIEIEKEILNFIEEL